MSATDTAYRTCPLCEAVCGLRLEVDRASRAVVSVRGDGEDPFSRGYICPKAYGLKELHDDPDRLRRPLRRTKGGFEEIGWEDAFDLAASGLRKVRDAHGPDAIGVYLGNPTVHNLGASIYVGVLLFGLGTKWRFSASSVDQLPKMVSSTLLFGRALSIPVPDLDRTDYLLILGANPLASNGSLCTAPGFPKRLRAIRERGGRVVVVDPRRSETARAADRHVAIRPGTDALLLFAMVQTILEEDLARPGRTEAFTDGFDRVRKLAAKFPPERVAPAVGIEAGEIRELARNFARARSAVCYGRIGTCTQEFGTLASWLVDVLNAITGNLDREGGAMFPRAATGPAGLGAGRKGRFPFDRWRSRVRGLPEAFGELPAATLSEEIDSAGEERVRALVTLCGNPVLSTPNAERLENALRSLDFMVSVDIYQNETTRFADVILPGSGPLEHSHYDLAFTQLSVRNYARWSPPTFEKPADSRDDWEIILELVGRYSGQSAEAIEKITFTQQLESLLGGSGIEPAEARAVLGDEPGPDRLVDLMVRMGPYGDRFGRNPGGLSLPRLREEVHGIDLGPLEPCLPDGLGTANGRIDLAPDFLVADVARLEEWLGRHANGNGVGLVLVGRRHLRSNNSWMHNVPSLVKGPERCTLVVHPDDAARLGLADGGRAVVRSRVGAVEVPVEMSDGIRPGVVSLPHGWGHGQEGARLQVAREHAGANSNVLADETLLDALSGNAVLNGIPVTVSPAG